MYQVNSYHSVLMLFKYHMKTAKILSLLLSYVLNRACLEVQKLNLETTL